MARTIQSPGVEVKEVDLSLRPNLPTGTTVFIPGFANQGPTDELLTLSSLSEFEQIYGLPQNAAERYLYHSVKAVFQSPANVLVTRLPYGSGAGATVADKYSVQVFPVIPRPIMVDADPYNELNTVAENNHDASEIVATRWYRIKTIHDDVDFTAIGASANEIGQSFQAISSGSLYNSGLAVVEPLFAWYPTELNPTAAGGDFIPSLPASITLGDVTITTIEKGAGAN